MTAVVTKFAFASSHSSKVRFIDASAGQWTGEVRQFPRGIGKLVESAGELLFFVRVTYDFTLSPPEAWAQVTTWNPFSDDTDTLPRPPSPLTNYRATRCFPHLVSAQLFYREYAPTYVPIADNPRFVRYINRLNLPPPEGYMFTMVCLDNEEHLVMGRYYSSNRTWCPLNCDRYVVREVADTGLHPPASILFRNTRTGSLAKFDAPRAFRTPMPNPHALDPCDKLDDPHTCVFVMPVPGSSQSIYELTPHVMQVERPLITWNNAPATVSLFKSPEINLRNIVSGVHETFVLGAKTGAIVVQREPVPNAWDRFRPKIHLFMFGTREWKEVRGTEWIAFESDDFRMGCLCQSTSVTPEPLKSSEVPKKTVKRWVYVPSARKWQEVQDPDDTNLGASSSDKNRDIATALAKVHIYDSPKELPGVMYGLPL